MKKNLLYVGIAIVAIAIIIVGIFAIKGRTYKAQNPIATIKVDGYDTPIKIELDPQSAPNAVANFIKLANNGFYNGYKMSIDEDAVVCNQTTEMARLSNIMEYPQNDYIYGIKGDFIRNGFDNLIKHKKGVITMQRDDFSYFGLAEEGYNSANCNFAILTQDKENYNGNYAAFGTVIEGMDVLEKIAESRVETPDTTTEGQEQDESINQITISSISVETYGIDYGLPEYVNYEENMEKVNKIYSQYFGENSQVNVE